MFVKRSLAILCLISVILSILIGASATAQISTSVSVINPSTGKNSFFYYTNVTRVGFRFNATVRVTSVTDLFAYQVYLTYNATLLYATRAWIPTWDTQWVFYGENAFPIGPDFKPAAVQIGATILEYPPPTFTGSGLLAIIEFEILTAPSKPTELVADLGIDNVDTYLLDADLNETSCIKLSGIYRFIWLEPGLQVRQTKVEFITLETFNITVWLNNATTSDRLVRVDFKLRYDSALLNVTQVIEGPFLSEFGTGSTTFNYDNDKIENVTISNYLSPPYDSKFPEGNGTIATITFEGIYQDAFSDMSCPLELIDVIFLNDTALPVTPMTPAINGVYTIRPKGSSLVTISVAPSSPILRSNVTVSGNISPSKTGVDVSLYYRLISQNWNKLATVQTDSQSNFTHNFNTTILGVGTFELKANWTGDLSTNPAESDIVILNVKKLPSAVSISVSPKTVTVGNNVAISGALNVTRAGVNVTIYYKLAGVTTWSWLANVTTSPVGSYYHVWTTTQAGTYEMYAEWSGDDVTSKATSVKEALTINKLPSIITLNVPTSITNGSTVTIGGSITPTKVGVIVTIYHKPPDGDWQVLTSTGTKQDSSYSFTWKPRNGTYELYSYWEGDSRTEADSSDLATLMVLLPSEITISVDTESASAGSNITITGTITPSRTNVDVFIEYRLNGTDAQWASIATVQTDSSGNYAFKWASTKQTTEVSDTLELRARWLGDTTYASAESSATTVRIDRVQSTLTLNVESINLTVETDIAFSGIKTPKIANANITILYREQGTTAQSNLTAKTNSEGRYVFIWKPTKATTYEMYAAWDGDADSYPIISDTITLQVNRAESSISLNLNPQIILAGSNITITGTITPVAPNADVTISYRLTETQEWSILATVKTGPSGSFTYTWQVKDSGVYELKASWLGNEKLLPDESETQNLQVDTPTNIWPYALATLAIAVAVIGVVLYYKKFRNRTKKPDVQAST